MLAAFRLTSHRACLELPILTAEQNVGDQCPLSESRFSDVNWETT